MYGKPTIVTVPPNLISKLPIITGNYSTRGTMAFVDSFQSFD